jgi:glucan-binding YG repeat protein
LKLSEEPSLGFSASRSWSSSDSTTASLDDSNSLTKDNNWSKQLSFSNSDRAKFAYVTRFKNTGTATAYDVEFEFQGSLSNGMAIPGINKRSDFVVNSLPAGKTTNRYNLGYGDAFGSSALELNAQQFAIWEKNPYIKILMPQTDAKMRRVDQNGTLVEYTGAQWDDLIDIAKQHAMLTLRLPSHEHERIVAAIDEDIPLSYDLPELDLRDALYVAYKIKESDGKYIYYNEKNNQKYTFDKIHFIINDFTKNQFNKQLAANPDAKKSPLDHYKLRQGMRILIAPYGWIYNELTKELSYAESVNGFYRNQAGVIDGKPYLFDNNGILIQDKGLQTLTGFQIKPRKYFNLSNGTLHHGWKQVGNSWYYFDDKLGYRARTNSWLDNGTNKYRFNAEGIMLTGLHEVESFSYYFATSSDSGPVGSMVKNNLVTINSVEYYCGPDGVCGPMERDSDKSSTRTGGVVVAAENESSLTYDNLRDGIVIDLTRDKVRGGFLPGYNVYPMLTCSGNNNTCSYTSGNLKEIALGQSSIVVDKIKDENGNTYHSAVFDVYKVNDCGRGKVYSMNSGNECDNNMKIKIVPQQGGVNNFLFSPEPKHLTGEFILQARGWNSNYVKNYRVKIDIKKPTKHGSVDVWNDSAFATEYFYVYYTSNTDGVRYKYKSSGIPMGGSGDFKIPDYASNIEIQAFWNGNLLLSINYPNDEDRNFYLESHRGGDTWCRFGEGSWGRPNSCK